MQFAVAYSGGLDSTVLLHGLARSVSSQRVLAIHVNHGLSPNADRWQTHCKTVCSQLGIAFRTITVTVPRSAPDGLESAARRLRYEALARESRGPILLAHHADDQAETVLHNLLRGAGVRGLAAMPEATHRLVRPFLTLRRGTLVEYAVEHGLSWCEDESNTDNRLTRNYLRNKIMPELVLRFPRATEQLARCAARMSDAQNLLEEIAESDAAGAPLTFPFPAGVVAKLPEHRARNLMLVLFHRNGLQNPGELRLREFVGQLRTARPDRNPEIRVGSISLRRKKNELIVVMTDRPADPAADSRREHSAPSRQG